LYWIVCKKKFLGNVEQVLQHAGTKLCMRSVASVRQMPSLWHSSILWGRGANLCMHA